MSRATQGLMARGPSRRAIPGTLRGPILAAWSTGLGFWNFLGEGHWRPDGPAERRVSDPKKHERPTSPNAFPRAWALRRTRGGLST
jgi:hypothetical protein